MNKLITYKEALAKAQKGFDKKSIKCSEASTAFLKELLIGTIENYVRNFLQSISTANSLYFNNPLSDGTKKMMTHQKNDTENINTIITLLRKSDFNKLKLYEHSYGYIIDFDKKLFK